MDKKNYDQDSKYGMLLEVDIKYPKELHESHRDLPFLCDRKLLDKTNKLITFFEDKKEQVAHTNALKQALNHGLKLKKIHKVIRFVQRVWMKPYSEKNTKLRIESKNEFEKNFYKLMSNSVYGKTMENIKKHRYITSDTNNTRRRKLASEPNYHTCKHFSENLIAIEMRKTKIHMRKPLYIGQALLDISKTLDMITLNLSMKIMQNYVTWIQTVLSYTLKQKSFTKILVMMQKHGLILKNIQKITRDYLLD